MWKQIRLLTGVQLGNAFDLNEARYGKDQKKKKRTILLGVAFAFVGFMIAFYIAAMAFGFVMLGVGEIIPAYLLAITSLIILFFTFSKAGDMIFNLRTYERVIALPVKPAAIVISRFLSMYLFNVALSWLVMLPGTVVYAIFLRPGFSFYLMIFVGTFLLPLLPMTISTAIGALILAATAKFKHKKVFSILLSLAFLLLVVVFPLLLSSNAENMTVDMITNFSMTVFSMIGKIYPPAILFSNGVVGGNWGAFALFIGISLAVFAVFVALVQRKFVSICTALSATVAKRNYKMQSQIQSSPLKALYKKELRRYFSSNIYVLNTSIGYLLMVLFAAGVLIAGPEKMGTMFGASGILTMIAPLILSFMCVIAPPSTVSISMEGKQWGILKALPVSAKTIFDSKILTSLTIALPCYIVSVILLCVALQPSWMDALWLCLLPLAYMVFSIVLGITVNRKMPMLNWESETVVVKQSGAVIVTMLIGMVSGLVPLILAFALAPGYKDLLFLVITLLLFLTTGILYARNNKARLTAIN